MTFGRLAKAEIKKLVRAPVFLVAPLVLMLYLFLMLFGYEVYAAKNGMDAVGAESLNGQPTGSAVVSAYVSVRRMTLNVFGLLEDTRPQPPRRVPGRMEEGEVLLEPPVSDGLVGKFDFWQTLITNLFNPKPFPKPPCDCPCVPQAGDSPKSPSERPPAGEPSALVGFFLGTAHAEGRMVIAPPPVVPTDSFLERLHKRLVWLTDSTSLEGKVIDRSRFNGMRFSYMSLHFALAFIFPVIAVSVAAQMFASEMAMGTFRTCLLMPANRWQFLFVKLMVLSGYLAVLFFAFSVLTMIVGVAFSGYGNLVLDSDILDIKGEGKLILADGAVMLILASAPVAVLSLAPLALIAVFLSFAKPEPAFVIGASSILYLMLFTLGGLPLFQDIRAIFFTTYMDGWLLMFDIPSNTHRIALNTTMVVLMALGILATVNRMFLKKDFFE